jgi:twinkle protein
MSDSLQDLFAEYGIKVKHFKPGNQHVICPKCDGGRTREISLSVDIDEDSQGARWICHRGKCDYRDGARLGGFNRKREESRQLPPPHSAEIQANRPDWLYEFFNDRNIGPKTIEDFGVYSVVRRFPGDLGEQPAIVFPYRWMGDIVNRKYRPYPAKQPQMQEKSALQTLFNVDSLGPNPDEVIWVEGEPDVMALWECGFHHAVSLKDGAPEREGLNGERRYAAMTTHADLLAPVSKFVLAGDTDPAGLALREELARRLGRHRCWTVDWPDGCKDACDTLKNYGLETVVACINDARPYPIEGIQSIQRGTLADLRRLPAPAVMTTGVGSTDRVLKLPSEGRLITVTGFPSSGKTSWVRFLMVHTALMHERRWLVFSPEMQPWEGFAAQLAEVYIGKPFYPHPTHPNMTDSELDRAEQILGRYIHMLVSDAEDEPPTIDWIIERARVAVLRFGITDLLIDPWNEVEHKRGDMSETEYTGRMLQRLKAFGLRHGCNVWIICHPAKPLPIRPGEKRNPPGPYEISGSAHWFNKSDVGITIHSENLGAATMLLWKARFRRWGQKQTSAEMDYDDITGRYDSLVADANQERHS